MSELAAIHAFLAEPMAPEVQAALSRVRRARADASSTTCANRSSPSTSRQPTARRLRADAATTPRSRLDLPLPDTPVIAVRWPTANDTSMFCR